MLVLAAVPDVQYHKLRRAAGARFPLAHARTWDDALATIRTRPVELAVVDPLLMSVPSATEIERLRLLFPSLPLILYTTLSPKTAAVLLQLGQTGIRDMVLFRYDDHPGRLCEVLVHEEARSASRRLLDQVAAVLAPLPSELRWVLEEVLRAPAELQAHAHLYLGLTAGEMRLTLEPAQALERVAQGFVPARQARVSAS